VADEAGSAAAYLLDRSTLTGLRHAARGCRGCPLWLRGAQTVFGEILATVHPSSILRSRSDEERRSAMGRFVEDLAEAAAVAAARRPVEGTDGRSEDGAPGAWGP